MVKEKCHSNQSLFHNKQLPWAQMTNAIMTVHEKHTGLQNAHAITHITDSKRTHLDVTPRHREQIVCLGHFGMVSLPPSTKSFGKTHSLPGATPQRPERLGDEKRPNLSKKLRALPHPHKAHFRTPCLEEACLPTSSLPEGATEGGNCVEPLDPIQMDAAGRLCSAYEL